MCQYGNAVFVTVVAFTAVFISRLFTCYVLPKQLLISFSGFSNLELYYFLCILILSLFRMGFFGAAHGWGRSKRLSLPKICHTYPTMIKLSTVIPDQKKIQKVYELRDAPLEFCWHQHFFYRKSANFAISRNVYIDCILIHNF